MNIMGRYFFLIAVCLVLLESVHCTRSSLFKRQTKKNRHASRDANVKTVHTRTAEEGDLRLADGATAVGRLEIYHDGSWGTICDDRFNSVEAHVACTSMGFTGGHMLPAHYSNSYYAGPIWLNDIFCQGDEANLLACRHRPFGEQNCDHSEDVFVDCSRELAVGDGQIQLVGGADESSGRVEISFDGQWGTVCHDFFDRQAATAVCRSLGYQSGTVDYFGAGDGPIVLDDVQCIGVESDIMECSHRPYTEHNCSHREDVGVTCE